MLQNTTPGCPNAYFRNFSNAWILAGRPCVRSWQGIGIIRRLAPAPLRRQLNPPASQVTGVFPSCLAMDTIKGYSGGSSSRRAEGNTPRQGTSTFQQPPHRRSPPDSSHANSARDLAPGGSGGSRKLTGDELAHLVMFEANLSRSRHIRVFLH